MKTLLEGRVVHFWIVLRKSLAYLVLSSTFLAVSLAAFAVACAASLDLDRKSVV